MAENERSNYTTNHRTCLEGDPALTIKREGKMAQEEERKQKGGGPGLGEVARLATARGGSRAAMGVAVRAGAAALPIIGPVIVVIAAVFFFIIFVVVIAGVIFYFAGGRYEIVYGEGEEEEETLSVTKTANPPQIKKNAPPTEVTYKITAENVTANTTLKDVKVSDGFLALNKPIGDLGPGDTHTETVKHTITDTSEDKIVTNTVTVTGTIPGAPPGGGESLYYYIPYGDASIEPVNPEGIKAFVRSNYPGHKIDDDCPGSITCWDYVINQSKSHGISPALSITIWWEESHFGRVGADEFGQTSTCGKHDTVSSLTCFLNFSGASPQIPADYFLGSPHPYDPADPMGSFTEWVRYMCGTITGPICSNNTDFISGIEYIYNNDVAPGNIVYVSNGQNQGSGETVTVTATATVIIGNPPQGPPAYAPLKGGVYCSGYDFGLSDPSPCPLLKSTHIGIDIATHGSDWNIYSPFAGVATVSLIDDDGDVGGNNFGVYMDLESGGFTVRMAHLERGSVRVTIGRVVNTGEALAVMGCSGTCDGEHIHYVMWKAGELVDPKEYGALTDHP
jgi:hypothetical protein